jgi:hypothetical protein
VTSRFGGFSAAEKLKGEMLGMRFPASCCTLLAASAGWGALQEPAFTFGTILNGMVGGVFCCFVPGLLL